MLRYVSFYFVLLQCVACGVAQQRPVVPACRIPEGALAFSELLPDPQGDDAHQEFIEMYNTSEMPIELQGLMLRIESSSGQAQQFTMQQSRVLDPHTYWTIGSSLLQLDEAVIRNDLDLSLSNEAATLTLFCGDTVLDSISYGSNTELGVAHSGESIGKDLNKHEWCSDSKNMYDMRNYGTPGDANLPCGFICMEHDAWRAVQLPVVASLRCERILADPDKPAADNYRDWIEILNVSDVAYDLNGLMLQNINTKGSKRIFTLEQDACLIIQPGQRMVFAGKNAFQDHIEADFILQGEPSTLFFNEEASIDLVSHDIILAHQVYTKPVPNVPFIFQAP